jgi:GPH family glycoside/pentoside/hexuronide:cation symporter
MASPVSDLALTLPDDRVPAKTKISFGLGGMLAQFTTNFTKELINPVFVVALHLSPALVGVAVMVFRIYDAFADPIMGWISDNTRTRFGRRRPWMLAGTFLCAATMPLLWLVHRNWEASTQLYWLISTGIVLFSAVTIYCVPYESFLLELTPDYKERTSVSSYKIVITSLTGLLIGWSWTITQLPIFGNAITKEPDTLNGARMLSLGVTLLIIPLGLAPVIFARERFYSSASKQAKVSLKSNLGATMRSRPFLILVGVSLTAVTGCYLSIGLTFFLRLYYVCRSDTVLAAKLNGVQSVLWLGVSLVSIFIFQKLSQRWSKTRVLFLAMSLSLVSVLIRWWVFRPSMPYLSLLSAGLLSAGMTGMWQMLSSMLADVVDADELITACRREGAFAAIYSWFIKLCYTVGIAFPGLIVGIAGFVVENGDNQAPGVITTLRLWDLLLPAGLIALSISLLALYPLSVARMGEIRRDLENRRGRL